jgi:hypothetical protein
LDTANIAVPLGVLVQCNAPSDPSTVAILQTAEFQLHTSSFSLQR